MTSVQESQDIFSGSILATEFYTRQEQRKQEDELPVFISRLTDNVLVFSLERLAFVQLLNTHMPFIEYLPLVIETSNPYLDEEADPCSELMNADLSKMLGLSCEHKLYFVGTQNEAKKMKVPFNKHIGVGWSVIDVIGMQFDPNVDITDAIEFLECIDEENHKTVIYELENLLLKCSHDPFEKPTPKCFHRLIAEDSEMFDQQNLHTKVSDYQYQYNFLQDDKLLHPSVADEYVAYRKDFIKEMKTLVSNIRNNKHASDEVNEMISTDLSNQYIPFYGNSRELNTISEETEPEDSKDSTANVDTDSEHEESGDESEHDYANDSDYEPVTDSEDDE